MHSLVTWRDLSLDCLNAAKSLMDLGHLRSSVSRSYYSAYCAITDTLVDKGINFAHGWNNPSHEQLPDLVLNNLALPRSTKFEINKSIRRLRMTREDADYRPGLTIDRKRTLDSLHDAIDVLTLLEINNNGTD